MGMNIRKLAIVAGSAACLSIGATATNAAVIVLGGGFAQMCYEAARDANDPSMMQITGSRIDIQPLEICTIALNAGDLTTRDLAGTYNNRGVILFSQGNFGEAMKDFDMAIRYSDMLAEPHVNRGASLVAMKQWRDAVPSLDKGIELGAIELEKAYYNRAIAHEELGDVRRAYFDYMKATELSPTWDEPKLQLTRFTVRKRP